MVSVNKRIFGYDLIKALAIFFIVLYHLKSVSIGNYSPNEFYLPNFNKLFISFCASGVPLFFMVNGALMIKKKLDLKQTFLKSFRLFFVSFFWATMMCYLLFPLLLNLQFPTLMNCLPFYWFLNTLVILNIVCYFLNRHKIFRLIAISVLLLFPFISNLIWDVIIFINPLKEIPKWGHTGVFTMYSIVYYYVGFYISELKIKKFLALFFILLGIFFVNFEVVSMTNHYHVIYDGVNAAFPTIGALFMSLGLFSLLKDCYYDNYWIRKVIYLFGRNTIGIYIFHLLFVFLIRIYVLEHTQIPLLFAIIISLCIVTICAFLSEFILKSRVYFLLKL